MAHVEHIEDGDRVKKYEITVEGTLTHITTKPIMRKITPAVEMRTKVVV